MKNKIVYDSRSDLTIKSYKYFYITGFFVAVPVILLCIPFIYSITHLSLNRYVIIGAFIFLPLVCSYFSYYYERLIFYESSGFWYGPRFYFYENVLMWDSTDTHINIYVTDSIKDKKVLIIMNKIDIVKDLLEKSSPYTENFMERILDK